MPIFLKHIQTYRRLKEFNPKFWKSNSRGRELEKRKVLLNWRNPPPLSRLMVSGINRENWRFYPVFASDYSADIRLILSLKLQRFFKKRVFSLNRIYSADMTVDHISVRWRRIIVFSPAEYTHAYNNRQLSFFRSRTNVSYLKRYIYFPSLLPLSCAME